MNIRHRRWLLGTFVLSGFRFNPRPLQLFARTSVLLAMLFGSQLLPAWAQTSDTIQVFSRPAAQTGDTIQVFSSPAASPHTASTEKFPVAGTVIDAVTGEPIRKALVQINAQQRRATFTDGDGRFAFESVPAGVVSFIAQKPGYFGEQEMRGRNSPQVEVGPKTDPVVLKLTPEGVIAGKVTTTNGVPLEHVSVTLNFANLYEGRRHWELKGNTITDEDGRFRFASLQPGTYYVGTAPYTPLTESLFYDGQPPKTGYPGVYYPGVPELASASPIQLNAGQQAEANFSLTEAPVYNIAGTITGYTPHQGVAVQVFDQSGVQVPLGVQFSPDNGRFDVRALPAGTYVLKAFSATGPNQPIRAETKLTVQSNIYNLQLVLNPALSIPVSVHTEPTVSANKNPGAYVGIANPGAPLSLRLLAQQPGTGDSFANLEGPPGHQSLILRNIDTGKYSVEAMPQGSWYVQSAEYGQTNLLTDDLVLTAGAPALPIEVVLRNDGASLAGTVSARDGADASATVVALAERTPNASPKIAYYSPPRDQSTQDTAAFTMDSLAPGDYLVLAFDHADRVEYANPEVLQNYLSRATHVTLVAGQQAKVTLDLIRTGDSSN